MFNDETEVNGPAKLPAEAAENEEATAAVTPVRANRRETRRQAHVPGPRRKPTFVPGESAPAKEETGGVASAKPMVSDEGVGRSSRYEDPITLGSVDR